MWRDRSALTHVFIIVIIIISFLKGLREACLADPGNPAFWQEARKQGAKMSLIGKSEAKRQGGRSDVPDDVARDVSPFSITGTGVVADGVTLSLVLESVIIVGQIYRVRLSCTITDGRWPWVAVFFLISHSIYPYFYLCIISIVRRLVCTYSRLP